MYPHGAQHADWNERLGGAQSGNGNVYLRSHDTDGGSNSSASNDTEYKTLLDESYRSNDRACDNLAADRGGPNRAFKRQKILLCFIVCVILVYVILAPSDESNRGRVGQIAGWGMNTSRQTIDYVVPYENTTLIDPLNVCSTEERAGLTDESDKVYLLIVVCSSASNFEARQTIRETWGNVREFNYDQFRVLHARLRGEYLDPKATVSDRLKEYMWWPSAVATAAAAASPASIGGIVETTAPNTDRTRFNFSQKDKGDSTLALGNFNIKIVFLVGQSESEYVHLKQQEQTPPSTGSAAGRERELDDSLSLQQHRHLASGGTAGGGGGEALASGDGPTESLFPSGADVDPAFNVVPDATTVDEVQLRILNESEVYGDIIQESFIDSYNNLTLKTIMMLKWVTSNCDGKQNISNKDRRFSTNNGTREYLQFQLEPRDYTGDINARMMVYVHGENWWRKNGPPGSVAPIGEVAFVIGTSAKGGDEIARFQGPIPEGDGRFIEFNVTDMMLQWFKGTRDPVTQKVHSNQYIVLETLNALSRRLVVQNPNGGQFVLLGGTVPLYKAAISFYDSHTVVGVKSSKNRLVEGKHLLTGFMFCDAKPIGDTSSKWYSPTYMYNKEVYPNYLSGTAYLMNFETAKALYRASLSTPIFHLEDVYLTGIVAERVKIRRRHHPLFFYSYTKDLCALRGMISQHQLAPGEIRNAYDYVTNSSILCNGPDKRLTVAKMKLVQRKKCQ